MKQKLKFWEEKCINHEVSEIFLINTCWNKIIEVFSNPDKVIEKYYNEKNKNNNLERYNKEKNKLIQKKDKIEKWIVKLYEDIALSNNDFEIKSKEQLVKKFVENKQEIENEIIIIEWKINSLKNKLKHLNNLNTLKEYYYKKLDNIDDLKKTEIIKELVERIIVYTNWDIKIIFKFEDINKKDDDDWRDIKETKSFMKEESDYETDIWWNSLIKSISFFWKSLTI
jgi:hypothetical protein